MLVVATAVGLLTRFRWNDPVYGAVFVWAFVGIVIARAEIPLIAVTGGVLAVVFAVSLFSWERRLGRLRGGASA